MNETLSLILPTDITCGYFDCSTFARLSVSPTRETNKYEIEYYLNNAFSTITDGVEYSIKADHILIVRPGQVRYSVLPFTTLYLKFSVSGSLAMLLDAAPEYFCAYHAQKIKALLYDIITLEHGGTEKELLFYSKVLEVLHLVLNDATIPSAQKNVNYDVATHARHYIDEHYCEPIHLKHIAASVSLSTTYFHNIFTATCGMTPHAYLTEKRIVAAKKLLGDTSISISDIADSCGFGCQQYFNDVFKRETGMAPGKYRKSFQQNYLL